MPPILERIFPHEGGLDIKGDIILRLLQDSVLVWIFFFLITDCCVALSNLSELPCFLTCKIKILTLDGFQVLHEMMNAAKDLAQKKQMESS